MGIFVAVLVGLFFLFHFYVSKRLRNKQDNELNKFFLPTKRIYSSSGRYIVFFSWDRCYRCRWTARAIYQTTAVLSLGIRRLVGRISYNFVSSCPTVS